MASMPLEMSRFAVLASTVASRAEESVAFSANVAVSASDTGALKASMPNASTSCALPPAEAMPKPMHPASTMDAHPTAAIFATMLDFRCLYRLSVKPWLPFNEQRTTRPPKR